MMNSLTLIRYQKDRVCLAPTSQISFGVNQPFKDRYLRVCEPSKCIQVPRHVCKLHLRTTPVKLQVSSTSLCQGFYVSEGSCTAHLDSRKAKGCSAVSILLHSLCMVPDRVSGKQPRWQFHLTEALSGPTSPHFPPVNLVLALSTACLMRYLTFTGKLIFN